jgi:outer membrane protein assembly factor BamB
MHLPRFASFCALVVAIAFTGSAARGDNWPAWRGPTGQGHTAEKNLPVKWSATEQVKWKIELPDAGNSTPIVWGDKIFLTQATEKGAKRSLWCLNRKDGSKLWEKTVAFAGKEAIHQTNTYCAASPVTDGECVVAFHGSAGLYCYDLTGKELWKKEFGPCDHIWGSAASPIIYKDLVVHNFGPHEKAFLIALKKTDGSEVWKNDEIGKKATEYFGSWSTPVVARIGDRTELLMSWPAVVKSYEPETGKLLWSSKGLEKEGGADRLTYTSTLASDKYVFAAGGFGSAAIGVKTGGTGDVTESHRLWRVAKNPQRIGSGVIVGEHAFVVNEPSVVCIDLKTGKQTWDKNIPGGAWGSIVHVDGKLYLTSQRGETLVFAANPKEYEEIAVNKLDGATTRASIVPSDGEFFIRTYKHLWCIGANK